MGPLFCVQVSESSRTLKKPSCMKPENERSALLSAIRAESNSARLKKASLISLLLTIVKKKFISADISNSAL